jgi:putative transposase
MDCGYILPRLLSVWKHCIEKVGRTLVCRLFSMPEYKRRLPHFQPNNAYLFLTWRLWGSLPAKAETVPHPTPGHAFAAADRELDRRNSGPLWLKDTRIAELVSRTILAGDSERRYYDLCAWVVMPNHVHLLVLPRVPVSRLMKWLKGSTARGANLILGRTEIGSGRTSPTITTCATPGS